MIQGDNGPGNGVPFLVTVGVVYEIVAATNSSPQTTEINAKSRAPTLMKWVHIGIVQSVFFVLIAAAMDKKRRNPILCGGFMAMILMYTQYVYAKICGLKSDAVGTEDTAMKFDSNAKAEVKGRTR